MPETIEHKGYRIEVFEDVEPYDPRTERDNFGTMVCWHRRGVFGDENPKIDPAEWLRRKLSGTLIPTLEKKIDDLDFNTLRTLFAASNVVVPIMAYEHGGITIRAYDFGKFPDQQWDCGQLGFIYVSHQDILREYGGTRMSTKKTSQARKCLEAEIEEYDAYLTGNVWAYTSYDPEGRCVGSCGGFYGTESRKYMIEEARSEIEANLEHREMMKAQALAFTMNPLAA